jgi:PAS domain S-box-containing protein
VVFCLAIGSNPVRKIWEKMILVDLSSEILELLPDAVVIVDEQGMIRYVNSSALSIFGYTSDSLLGEKIEILIPEKNRSHHSEHRKTYTRQPTKKLMSKRTELSGMRKDGSLFPVEISLGPINVDKRTFIIAIVRDTSSRHYIKLLENKNRELEQFAYIASHDLQEPLQTVISFAELLEKEYPDELHRKAGKYLDFIMQAGKRMSNMVKELMAYSLIGRNDELTDVDCNKIIKAIQDDVDAIITETGATFHIEELPQLKGYENQLRMLFQNLILNAIKFRKKDTTPSISISAYRENNHWVFAFKDNGIGIAPEHSQRIFKIFQRLHNKNEYEGPGIGLAHCQKAAELHGGSIWMDSQPGQGSTFYVSLPI